MSLETPNQPTMSTNSLFEEENRKVLRMQLFPWVCEIAGNPYESLTTANKHGFKLFVTSVCRKQYVEDNESHFVAVVLGDPAEISINIPVNGTIGAKTTLQFQLNNTQAQDWQFVSFAFQLDRWEV